VSRPYLRTKVGPRTPGRAGFHAMLPIKAHEPTWLCRRIPSRRLPRCGRPVAFSVRSKWRPFGIVLGWCFSKY